MISSYRFAQENNLQSILHGAWLALVALIVFLAKLETYMLIAVLGAVLGLAMFAIVASIPPTFWLGLAIVGAFGWATYPRSKAVRA